MYTFILSFWLCDIFYACTVSNGWLSLASRRGKRSGGGCTTKNILNVQRVTKDNNQIVPSFECIITAKLTAERKPTTVEFSLVAKQLNLDSVSHFQPVRKFYNEVLWLPHLPRQNVFLGISFLNTDIFILFFFSSSSFEEECSVCLCTMSKYILCTFEKQITACDMKIASFNLLFRTPPFLKLFTLRVESIFLTMWLSNCLLCEWVCVLVVCA